MHLRAMEAADLEQLWAEFQDVIREGATYAYDNSTSLRDFERDWCGRGGEQWVADEGGEILGAFTLRANHPGRGSHVATASYFVARRARGRGLGRQLGEHSLERARALGFEAVQFNFVVSTNTSALRLWRRLGFEVVGELPRAFRHAQHGFVGALVLRRDLLPASATPLDGLVHQAVIASFVQRGFAPDVEQLARTLAQPAQFIESALERLHRGHGLVLHPGSHSVWIAHPFSSTPTTVWVETPTRGWWAPCLWCALGVCALAAPNAHIHARVGGERDALRIEVRDGELVNPTLLVHFGAPPRHAWDNVHAWCASVQPFERAEHVDAWCARHALPRGECVPIAQVQRLARTWYGRHLDADWRKWSVAQAQAIFDAVGLRGEFWRLPSADQPF